MPIKYSKPPDLKWVRGLVNYDPLTGLFSFIEKGTCFHNPKTGYVKICFKQKSFSAHRLAWYLSYNEWPNCDIDHKDRNRSNNILKNLRKATRRQTCRNRSKQKRKDLPLGVYKAQYKTKLRKTNKKAFYSLIKINQKCIRLGSFATVPEAEAAYKAASIKLYGEYSPYWDH